MKLEPDERYMWMALDLARRGLGKTNPNPMVGAVIVKGGEVVGTGFHEKVGERMLKSSPWMKGEGPGAYIICKP